MRTLFYFTCFKKKNHKCLCYKYGRLIDYEICYLKFDCMRKKCYDLDFNQIYKNNQTIL